MKHTEQMWCFNCSYKWETKDYLNEKKCPNCKTKPVRIYRTSSTAFVYAAIEKEKLKKEIEE